MDFLQKRKDQKGTENTVTSNYIKMSKGSRHTEKTAQMLHYYDAPNVSAQTSPYLSYNALSPIIQGKFEGSLAGKDASSVLSEITSLYEIPIPVHKTFLRNFVNAAEASEDSYQTIEELIKSFHEKYASIRLTRKDASGSQAVASPVQYGQDTVYDWSKLNAAIKALYDSATMKKPTKDEMLKKIVSLYTKESIMGIVGQAQFVADLQNIVRAAVSGHTGLEDFLAKTIITHIDDPENETQDLRIPAALSIDKFVLRHYTSGSADKVPEFRTIQSALSLGISQINTSQGGHTENTDWNTFGNIGNTFFILLIDGHFVCKQRFIENCFYYTDIPLQDINQPIWFSSDWLDQKAIKGTAYEGTAAQVHKQLIRVVQDAFNKKQRETGGTESFESINSDEFTKLLSESYNNFEVKVRGPVDIRSHWVKKQ